MTITEGRYRGAHINMDLCLNLGSICVDVDFFSNRNNAELFSWYISEDLIREINGIPNELPRGCLFSIIENNETCGYRWMFDPQMLESPTTQFGYIHLICATIDKMADHIVKCQKENASKIVFRKGSEVCLTFDLDGYIRLTQIRNDETPWYRQPFAFENDVVFRGSDGTNLNGKKFILADDVKADFFGKNFHIDKFMSTFVPNTK